MPKLPSKKTLRTKADKLWSWAVKEDWGWKCAVCECVDSLESHHLITKGSCNAHRYTLENGICLCTSHHMFDSHCSAHQGTIGFSEFLRQHHPHIIDWVIAHTHDTLAGSSVSQGWYLEKIIELREYVDADAFSEIVGVQLAARLSSVK